MAVYTTASHSWAVGETVTAANMNSQVRDFSNGFGVWTAYTPTWTSSGTAPVLGNGTLTGAYTQVGKMVWFRASLTAGSTTTYGTGSYLLSLPVTTPTGAYTPIATVTLVQSPSIYLGTGYVASPTTLNFLVQNAAGASTTVGQVNPNAWASGQQLVIAGTYQSV